MKKLNTLACMSVLCLAAGPLYAAGTQSQQATGTQSPQATGTQSQQAGTVDTETMIGEQQNARETVREAARVVEQIRAEPESRNTLQQAQAVFIVPDYGRASLGVGAAGGQGVLVVNREGEWSGPAFYNIGGLNLGLAAGVEAGSIAFMIMSDDAMQGFHSPNNFSLNADAGLTILGWSARGQVASGKGADVIVWSDTEGLYGDLAISVSNIFWDDEANQAYYRQELEINDVLLGTVLDTAASSPLKAEFSALEMATEPSDAPMSSDEPMMEREPAAKPQGSEY